MKRSFNGKTIMIVLFSMIIIALSPSLQAQTMSNFEMNTDRFGADYHSFRASAPKACSDACLRDQQCLSYTFLKPQNGGTEGLCYLKNFIPQIKSDTCCISGVKNATVVTPTGQTPATVVTRENQNQGNATAVTAIGNRPEHGTNRPGGDYRSEPVFNRDYNSCKAFCDAEERCKSFSVCQYNLNAFCDLKETIPNAVQDDFCTSGVKAEHSRPYVSNSLEHSVDRPGSDYNSIELTSSNPQDCKYRCETDPQCKAFTYLNAGIHGPNAICYLKNSIPSPVPNNNCTSGISDSRMNNTETANNNRVETGIIREESQEDILCTTQGFEVGTDRPGSDYHTSIPNSMDPAICRTYCTQDPECKAFTYAKSGVVDANPFCWFKNRVPDSVSNPGMVSWVKPASTTPNTLIENQTDRPGCDYKDVDMPTGNAETCREQCNNEDECKSYSYVRAGVQGTSAKCWLKNCVPPKTFSYDTASGVK